MIYWDTSAIVPLVVDEPESPAMHALARGDRELVVFWSTPIECLSALARRAREAGLSRRDTDAARDLLTTLRGAWSEVLASDEVRATAERLLLRHPLRAADALQLGAALTWAHQRPRSHVFACLDDRLRTAARGEGFRVVPDADAAA